MGAGIPLQDVQDAMGHADPRTTRAYDRSRHRLDNHATYARNIVDDTTESVSIFGA